MKPKIIVCGLSQTGYKILCLLRQQGAQVVGISAKPIEQIDHDAMNIIIGDLRSETTLLKAGVQDAQTLILATNDDAVNLAVLLQARVLNPHIRIINRLFNSTLGDRLDHTLPNHFTMSVAALSAPVFTFAALGNRAIGQLCLFRQTWPMHEEYIDRDHPWWGRSLAELWENRSRMLIYYLPADQRMDLVSAVLSGQRLQRGDRLIIATYPQVQTPRRQLKQRLVELLIRLRHLQHPIRPTFVGLVALLITILTATFTYITANHQTSIVDALYFSVGMITGAGGNEAVIENSPPIVKLFTVIMMFVGAGVVGICYALLNDLVLGTRLKQIWYNARIPQRHHYIVCGLGGIGIQIVNHLQAQGCEVVVIEPDPNNRFLSSAHTLKVPIIQGDASVPAALKAAHVEQAEALLAVTSDDVVNLAIALSAKGLAPKLPVIVRNEDPCYAPLAQRVFDFEAVLSPAELAAPSFAAAALGGRILGNGMTANTLWVALATMITHEHPFCGKTVKEVAMDADFVPLYIEIGGRTIHGWKLLEIVLKEGDVLYLTIPATALEQLWRSPSAPVSLLK
jgi:Trk K+ transport system NAD-binding subunit